MNIFLVDFSGSNDFAVLFPAGHHITTEQQDGANAYKLVGEQMPDKIFVNYSSKPSHGRQTALSIKNRKKTAGIPIYFVNGDEQENEKVAGVGLCIEQGEIAVNL